MSTPPFRLDDLHRILFGHAQWPFLLEVWLRTTLTYVLLVVAMRLLGRRVAAQFTLFEISIVVTLAAAIGVPLQAANRGMLPPLLIVGVVIVLQRSLMHLGVRSRRVETTISTDLSTLIIDGELVLDGMRKASMGRKTVFALLRARGLQQLGQVSRLYMEPSGSFSLIKAAPEVPGLAVIPQFDTELLTEARAPGHFACECCGHTVALAAAPDEPCEACHQHCWLPAVLRLEH